MPFKPLLSGDAIVEITTDEYFNLARKAERIAAVERFVNANDYVTAKDILALLDIEKYQKTVTKKTSWRAGYVKITLP